MKEKVVPYEGYLITIRTEAVAESETWSAVLVFSNADGENKESWMISAGDQFESEEQALTYCLDFAREVVDKELKGCSIDA